MFKNPFKRIKYLEDLLENYKSCEECGVVYKKSFMKHVSDYFDVFDKQIRYYCPKHIPRYDKIVWNTDGEVFYYKSYVKVDKKGREINNK